jgi:hypothetical protein
MSRRRAQVYPLEAIHWPNRPIVDWTSRRGDDSQKELRRELHLRAAAIPSRHAASTLAESVARARLEDPASGRSRTPRSANHSIVVFLTQQSALQARSHTGARARRGLRRILLSSVN